MRKRRYGRVGRFGPYMENQAEAAAAEAAIPAAARAAVDQAEGALAIVKQKRNEMQKVVDKQMKSTLEFMKQAIGGMLGFAGVNAVESVVEKTFIGGWGKLASKGIATGGVYLTARMISDDNTVRRAVLIGALINVGLSVVSDALAGKGLSLGPGLSGANVIPYKPDYGEYDYSESTYDYTRETR